MTRLSRTLTLASAIVLLAATTAPAGYLGVANYRNCGCDQEFAKHDLSRLKFEEGD